MMPQIADVINNSVTKNDVEGQYRRGAPGSVWHFFFPVGGENQIGNSVLPPEPPPYWTRDRDRLLRYTCIRGGLWAESVGIACTKIGAQDFEIEGDDVPQLVKRTQQMMLALDGKGYVNGVQRGVRDFLTCDNGEFWEIVRASNAAGSRVLGLMHLDSIRCTRTGDDEIPLTYLDLKGYWHELHDHEVIMMCDMPSASAELFGVGLCAASRAYKAIFKLDVLATYFNEKVTGRKANEIHLVNGVSEKTLTSAIRSADAQQVEQGFQVYKNTVIIPVYSENAVSGYKIEVAGVPDGFNHKEEVDLAILEYANAIGLDLQDIQPLSGQGLGTGKQSEVQMEKAKGKGLSARNKSFAHNVNEKVAPDKVTFYFKDVDLVDETKKAANALVRAQTRQIQVTIGEINAEESRSYAVEQEDLPKEMANTVQAVNALDDTLNDEEKPEVIDAADQANANQQAAPSTTPAPAPPAGKQSRENALLELAAEIKEARRELQRYKQEQVDRPMLGKALDALTSAFKQRPADVIVNASIGSPDVRPIADALKGQKEASVVVNLPEMRPVINTPAVTNNFDPTIQVAPSPAPNVINLAPKKKLERMTTRRGPDGHITGSDTEIEYDSRD